MKRQKPATLLNLWLRMTAEMVLVYEPGSKQRTGSHAIAALQLLDKGKRVRSLDPKDIPISLELSEDGGAA